MGIEREFWTKQIKNAWKKMPIVWLSGVRRTGKTTLSKFFSEAEFLNCDLPRVQEMLADAESFFKECKNKIIIFDEIHQLTNPTSVLKIASDEFPSLRILATGSSTLVASQKFKDSLTGRKRNIHFLPVLVSETDAFGASIDKRILNGGLPPALLSDSLNSEFYSEWLDSFYARDVQEIFKVEKRQPFLKALEWLLIQNGNSLDISKLAQISGVSRPTITKYLDILEATKAISVIRPYFQNADKEIVNQPKVYGFDTGFCCYVQGINELRNEDKGKFLENLTLETMQAVNQENPMYWRNKNGNEIDFVIRKSRNQIDAIECKWKEKQFDPKNLTIFRNHYNMGKNIIITSDSRTRKTTFKNLILHWVNIKDWQGVLEKGG